jgi:hypothetical protein
VIVGDHPAHFIRAKGVARALEKLRSGLSDLLEEHTHQTCRNPFGVEIILLAFPG